MSPLAIVVQCFVKLDTLQGLLKSLLRCEGYNDVSLIIWQDSPRGGRREAEFLPAFELVHRYIVDFVCEHGRTFQSLDYRFNKSNLGPYATCRTALDYAFKNQDFVVLVEDDIVLSADALLWFAEVRDQGLLEGPDSWAAAGESIFFDARDKIVSETLLERALHLAESQQLVQKFTTHDFVPSACFATTRRWWSQIGATRGEPRGDEALCRRTKEERKSCVFPIVPRAKDVGMLHEYGFSVTIHGTEGVQAITNPYLLAEDLLPKRLIPQLNLERFAGDLGLLYRQTTLLEEVAPSNSARVEAANAATQAKDWQRAAALWDDLRCEFPNEALYWLKAGEAFSEARMLVPAECILAEAVSRFPDERWIGHQYALVANRAGNWAEALKRAEVLRQAAPDF